MKKTIFLLMLLINVSSLYAQSTNENYVRTTEVTVKGKTTSAQVETALVNERIINYTYFDGLGRPIQNVTQEGSPQRNDIVQPILYDDFGREKKKYLPFVAGNSGAYIPTAAIINQNGDYIGVAQPFYANDSDNKIADDPRPYSEIFFEPSPLNRAEKEYGVGFAWAPVTGGNNKFILHQYLSNEAGELIIAWKINGNALPEVMQPLQGFVETGGYYSANQLYIKSTFDEEGHAVREYTNKLGQVVLKKVQVESGSPNLNSSTGWASTYYIYDDLDNLACVIPPEAVARLATEYYHGSADNGTKESFLSTWAFRYTYDERRRISRKQVPGADRVFMVYDIRDRLVMTQDGNQRDKQVPEWLFTKYDQFNRPILTGIYADSESLNQFNMQQKVNNFYQTGVLFEIMGGGVHGYTNQSFPQVSADNDYLTVTYYDDYTFQTLLPNVSEFEFEGYFDRVQGMTTGTKIKNLGTNEWMWSVNYYDDRYQAIHIIAHNSKGGIDKFTNVYDDFGRKVVNTKTEHVISGSSETITRTFTYDHMERLLQTEHQIGTLTPPVVISANEYNELGQLVTKKLHQLADEPDVIPDPLVGQPGVVYARDIILEVYDANVVAYVASNSITILPGFSVPPGGTLVVRLGYSQADADAHNNSTGTFAQEIDYGYNIRGWLDNINDVDATNSDDFFSMDLNYNNPVTDGGPPQFNGNISQALWKGPDGKKKSYGYYYDPMNRLIKGQYYDITSGVANGRFTEKIGDDENPAYDLNGNIQNLFRYGKTGEDFTGKVLYGLMDDLLYNYNGNQLLKVIDDEVDTEGFKDGSNSDEDYGYDLNGNMHMDKNKSLGENSITYNYLNLPQRVEKSPTEYVQYVYDAAGRKLKQVAVEETTKTTEYVGEFVYENDVLQFINHEEGRIVMIGAAPEYQYHLKDHLGNVRTTFTTKEVETEVSLGTSETANENEERAKFLKYDDVRRVNHRLFDHTNTGETKYAIRLTGTTVETYGLARSMSVMPGDKIKAEVFAKYVDLSETNEPPLEDFINAIIMGTATAGTVIDGSAYGTPDAITIPFGTLLDPEKSSETGEAPKSYLNWLVFDNDRNPILSKCGYKRMSTIAKENGQGWPDAEGKDHQLLQSPEIEITEAGYVYIYFSTEEQGYEVYFDDFKVEQIMSSVVQSDDYYPFGLTFNSYQRENSVANLYQYNGKEKQDELDLGWLDYGARMYMPELGRWGAIDRKAEAYTSWNPYNYTLNNPIKYIDPNGEDVYLIIWGTADGEIGHAGIAVDNYKTEKYKAKEKYKDADGKTRTRTVEKERQVKDGTVTYYDLWPGNEGGVGKDNFDQDVKGNYNKTVTTLDALKTTDITGSEGRPADGIVQLETSPQTDKLVQEQGLQYFKDKNPSYNGLKCNCSDYAAEGIMWAAPPGSPLYNSREKIGSTHATTPNQLYKATIGLPNATIIKDPGTKVEKKFIEGVTGGGALQRAAEKRMN